MSVEARKVDLIQNVQRTNRELRDLKIQLARGGFFGGTIDGSVGPPVLPADLPWVDLTGKYGASNTGAENIDDEIDAAIADAPDSGSVVLLRGMKSVYRIDRTVLNPTDKPMIFVGGGQGYPSMFHNQSMGFWNREPQTKILWGSTDKNPMFEINGVNYGVQFHHIGFDGGGYASKYIDADRWQEGGMWNCSAIKTCQTDPTWRTGVGIHLHTQVAIGSAEGNTGLHFSHLLLDAPVGMRLDGNSSHTVTVRALGDSPPNSFETEFAHGFAEGRLVKFEGGPLPDNISEKTWYYVRIDGLPTLIDPITGLPDPKRFAVARTSGGGVVTIGPGVGTNVTVVTEPSANSHNSYFEDVFIHFGGDGSYNAPATLVRNGDNDFWLKYRAYRAQSSREHPDDPDYLPGGAKGSPNGTGHGLRFGDMGRYNYFYHVRSIGGCLTRTPAKDAGFINHIFGYDREDGQQMPELEEGADLYWTEFGNQGTGAYMPNFGRSIAIGGEKASFLYGDFGMQIKDELRTVTAATDETPVVMKTSVKHGWRTGDKIKISNVEGNLAANGDHRIKVLENQQKAELYLPNNPEIVVNNVATNLFALAAGGIHGMDTGTPIRLTGYKFPSTDPQVVDDTNYYVKLDAATGPVATATTFKLGESPAVGSAVIGIRASTEVGLKAWKCVVATTVPMSVDIALDTLSLNPVAPHGFVTDKQVKFKGTLPTPLVEGTIYYVHLASVPAPDQATKFKLAATAGGAPLDLGGSPSGVGLLYVPGTGSAGQEVELRLQTLVPGGASRVVLQGKTAGNVVVEGTLEAAANGTVVLKAKSGHDLVLGGWDGEAVEMDAQDRVRILEGLTLPFLAVGGSGPYQVLNKSLLLNITGDPGGRTVTLPAAPAKGQLVQVTKTDADADPVNVVPSGAHVIEGGNPSLTSLFARTPLYWFNDGTSRWQILAGVGGTGSGTPDPAGDLEADWTLSQDSPRLPLKQSVRVAATGNILEDTAPAVIDGVTMNGGDRVLLPRQTAKAENGLWIYPGTPGAPLPGTPMLRATDMSDIPEFVVGHVVAVREGTTFAGTLWEHTSGQLGGQVNYSRVGERPVRHDAVSTTALSAATVHNLSTLNSDALILLPNQNVRITGFANQENGKRLIIRNDTAFNVTFAHEDATATTLEHRILTGAGDITVEGGGQVEFWYSNYKNRWLLLSTGGESGGVPPGGGAGGILAGNYPNPSSNIAATPEWARLGLGIPQDNNSRLRFPVGTTAVNGIDFGGDKLYRFAAGALRWESLAGNATVRVKSPDGSYAGLFFSGASSDLWRIRAMLSDNDLEIRDGSDVLKFTFKSEPRFGIGTDPSHRLDIGTHNVDIADPRRGISLTTYWTGSVADPSGTPTMLLDTYFDAIGSTSAFGAQGFGIMSRVFAGQTTPVTSGAGAGVFTANVYGTVRDSSGHAPEFVPLVLSLNDETPTTDGHAGGWLADTNYHGPVNDGSTFVGAVGAKTDPNKPNIFHGHVIYAANYYNFDALTGDPVKAPAVADSAALHIVTYAPPSGGYSGTAHEDVAGVNTYPLDHAMRIVGATGDGQNLTTGAITGTIRLGFRTGISVGADSQWGPGPRAAWISRASCITRIGTGVHIANWGQYGLRLGGRYSGAAESGAAALFFDAATNAAGGMGFGGDFFMYRSATDTLKLDDARFDIVYAAGSSALRIFATGDSQPRCRVLADGDIDFGPGGSTAPDIKLSRITTEVLGIDKALSLRDTTGKSYLEMFEQSADPAAPAANRVRLFPKDNGAGKTQLMALFNTGVAQEVAIQP
jgi:hypothetical protein